jgi:hypothetical protein
MMKPKKSKFVYLKYFFYMNKFYNLVQKFKDYELAKYEFIKYIDEERNEIIKKNRNKIKNNDTTVKLEIAHNKFDSRQKIKPKIDHNNNGLSNKIVAKEFLYKLNTYFEPNNNKSYDLHIIRSKTSNNIYVHWTEVAVLLGLTKKIFKNHLISLVDTNKITKKEIYVEVFEFNDENLILFELIHYDFNINLDNINETTKLFMLNYHKYIK